jgi:hypothetical protein
MLLLDALKSMMTAKPHIYKDPQGYFIIPIDVDWSTMMEDLVKAGAQGYHDLTAFVIALQAAGASIQGTDYRGSLWLLPK